MATPPLFDRARLLLGPVLRHVGRTTATVWVQTSRPAEVELLGCRASTFTVCRQHYALVEVSGLVPGSVTAYQVHLDGERVWPPPWSSWPESRIRTRGGNAAVRVIFGSCRRATPDDPKAAAAIGTDALDVLAARTATMAPQEWPDALLLLGDQVYADEPTPQTKRWMDSRRDTTAPPGHEVVDFTEYARLYVEATSAAWREWITAQPWWADRIRGALASYWVYQHLGNLSAERRQADATWRAVQGADGDAWVVLQEMADALDTGAAPVRWNFRWDIEGIRLIVIDIRCGRVLTEGRRAMLDDAEFSWLEDGVSADAHQVDHLLVGCSLPWLLAPALHDLESANEAACARGGALAERIRQALDLEHWAAFRDSFDRLTALLRRVAAGPDAPATISVLSGDVHHSYVARADFNRAAGGSPGYQLVSSALHHGLPWYAPPLLRLGWIPALAAVVRSVVRRFGVPDPALSWRLLSRTVFDNAVATLVFSARNATLVVESSRDSGQLQPEFQIKLAPHAASDRQQIRQQGSDRR